MLRQNAGIERLMVEALPGPFVAHGKVREGRLESAHGLGHACGVGHAPRINKNLIWLTA